MDDLKVLITGGAGNIGKSIASFLVKQKIKVLLTDIRDDLGYKITESFNFSGIKYIHLDVRKEGDWIKTFETNPDINILINNAGIIGFGRNWGPQDPENQTFESWHEVHSVNLDGVFLGSKHFIVTNKNRTGKIINIASRSGVVGVPTCAAYASSKAAVRNHTKTVALYCANKKYDISCNAILPASIDTDMWGQDLIRRRNINKLSMGIPVKRFGKPEDVAELVLFLVTMESKYITGAEFCVDGGVLAGSIFSPIPY